MAPKSRHRSRGSDDPRAVGIEIVDAGGNAYAAAVDERHGIDPRSRKTMVVCLVLAVFYVVALLLPKNVLYPLLTGDAPYALATYVRMLTENVGSLLAVLTGNASDGSGGGSLFASQMIRYVVVALAGAGLALTGAIYQGAFRNALVSPSTLGVMTGGQFGVVAWAVAMALTGHEAVFLNLEAETASGAESLLDYAASSYGLALASFAGCFLVVGLVLLTLRAAGSERLSGIMLIITGQVVGSVVGVFGALVRYYYVTVEPFGGMAQFLQNVQVASFYRHFGVIDIACLGIPLALTFVVVMLLSRKMQALALDRAEQRSLGVETGRVTFAVVGLCTLLTAFVISFCGAVGFVGFLVPHLARRLVGPEFRYLLPASTAIGALFVLGAFVIVQVILGDSYSTMSGMFISIGGAVVFLATALRGKGVPNGTFLR